MIWLCSLAITYACSSQMWTSVEVFKDGGVDEDDEDDDVDANAENWMAD